MFTNYFEGCFGLLPSSIGAKTNSQRETGHGPIGNLPSPDRGTSVGSPKSVIWSTLSKYEKYCLTFAANKWLSAFNRRHNEFDWPQSQLTCPCMVLNKGKWKKQKVVATKQEVTTCNLRNKYLIYREINKKQGIDDTTNKLNWELLYHRFIFFNPKIHDCLIEQKHIWIFKERDIQGELWYICMLCLLVKPTRTLLIEQYFLFQADSFE